MSELTDHELWRRAAGGDARAFGAIYERHGRAVLAYLLWRTGDPASAEDLAQVVFLEAWRKRGQWVLTTDSARPLLLGIALNVARNQWRSRRRHRAALERLAIQTEAHEVSAEEGALERLAATERLTGLREQLDAVPHREREVLALTALAGLTYEEAAEVLGVPVGTVRSRLARARSRLVETTGSPPGPRPPRPGAPPLAAAPIDPTFIPTTETTR